MGGKGEGIVFWAIISFILIIYLYSKHVNCIIKCID